ncbi:YlaC family protein [Pantoea sp. 1.19]|uniref:YlaC family protein n=1 Tax=Pantoea sp. 1.19 TaxID=1925589 RepID=UPI000948D105|nr:YlaC family protein [Pantoea sp. 1.19]
MDAVKRILQQEIDRLNQQERRDNKPRFSLNFLRTHPGLWLVMYLCYGLTVALIFSTPWLGWPVFWGSLAFMLVMSLLMLLDITPTYRFEDIDRLDIRVCYYGEWYYIRTLSPEAVAELMAQPAVPDGVKQGMTKLLALKGAVDFYDVYHLTWGGKRASRLSL